MFLGRIGSLNALEQTRTSRDWKKLLHGKELPSADTLGRVAAVVNAMALREILVKLQRKMRQKKALPKLTDHLVALVFDGHESMSSFLRKPCGGCLERKVGKPGEERVQSYHRSGFTSFPTVDRPLRVVKSLETWWVKRQRTGRMEEMRSRWMWATTISEERADTREMVRLGHSRWDIENQGFNEAVNRYEMDHVYRHEPNAMVVICLLAMLAMNLFEVFYRRSLKPALQESLDRSSIAQMVRAALCPKERNSAAPT